MKLKLNKKKLKNLSNDKKSLPANMTPQIGGGNNACHGASGGCQVADQPHGGITDVPVTY